MEKAKQSVKGIAISLILVVLGLIVVTVVLQSSQSSMLYPAEVREYKGEDLSSVGDIRENTVKGIQYINGSTYRLQISGKVNQTAEYTYDQVLNDFPSYQKVVTLYCVEGWSAKILWEGVLVSDLLEHAGVDSNATTVIFYASDNYSTALPLSYIADNQILLAYKVNDITLPPERGFPFQLVAESQYGYKWIKWVTQIEVSDNPDYLGYWESRGLPNNATIP
ncbi:MAG: molybdopterin-dependent oxidoreductase [Candidatus Bathyarchaeota archaeon]|nr:molybdopterin-dependent oxidoreductase [Candidatus Bathyarchaeota archaeon]